MKEEDLHIQICDYIKLQYPDVIFTSESSGEYVGGKDGKGWARLQKMKRKRSIHKLPDIWIVEPNSSFHGMFLEIKKESPFKKNGELKAGGHLEAQSYILEMLKKKRYFAQFVWTFDDARFLIDLYMSTRP